MIKINVFDKSGNNAGNIDIDESCLGGVVKYDLLREAVSVYESRKRVITRHTKTRAEVEGSGRKLYRQKHTGMARAGTIRTPVRRGGGMAFALDCPNYRLNMPRTAKRAALKSALLARLMDAELAVFAEPDLEQPKTKVIAELLAKIGVQPGQSCLIVTGDQNEMLYKSARNIPGVTVRRLQDLNAYDVLCPHRVLFTGQAMEAFLEGNK